MKNETNNGITRRSFMKRSTVAAIATTNMMMFTGLVNAIHVTPSPFVPFDYHKKCNVQKMEHKIVKEGMEITLYICSADLSCKAIFGCGDNFEFDQQGRIVRNPDGSPKKVAVKLDCDEIAKDAQGNPILGANGMPVHKTVACIKSWKKLP